MPLGKKTLTAKNRRYDNYCPGNLFSRPGEGKLGVMVMAKPGTGKADLRYALYQAAFIASLSNKGFMTYYTNKLRGRQREKGISTKMRVKLAAKLLVIAWLTLPLYIEALFFIVFRALGK